MRTLTLLVILTLVTSMSALAVPEILNITAVGAELSTPILFFAAMPICITGFDLGPPALVQSDYPLTAAPTTLAGMTVLVTQGATGWEIGIFAVIENKIIAFLPYDIIPGTATVTVIEGSSSASNAWPITIGSVQGMAGNIGSPPDLPPASPVDPVITIISVDGTGSGAGAILGAGGMIPTIVSPLDSSLAGPGDGPLLAAAFITGPPLSLAESATLASAAGGMARIQKILRGGAKEISSGVSDYPYGNLYVQDIQAQIVDVGNWTANMQYIIFAVPPAILRACWAMVHIRSKDGLLILSNMVEMAVRGPCQFYFPQEHFERFRSDGVVRMAQLFFDLVDIVNVQTGQTQTASAVSMEFLAPIPFDEFIRLRGCSVGCTVVDGDENQVPGRYNGLRRLNPIGPITMTLPNGQTILSAAFETNRFWQNPVLAAHRAGKFTFTGNVPGLGGAFTGEWMKTQEYVTPNVGVTVPPGLRDRTWNAGEDYRFGLNGVPNSNDAIVQAILEVLRANGRRRRIVCTQRGPQLNEIVVPGYVTAGLGPGDQANVQVLSTFAVDSFFDVFTELSIDGGTSRIHGTANYRSGAALGDFTFKSPVN